MATQRSPLNTSIGRLRYHNKEGDNDDNNDNVGFLSLFHIGGGGGGGGGADSARLQTVFFITSVRDDAEPQNLVTFPKLQLMENRILNMKMTNFQADSRYTTIVSKRACPNVVKLRLYCHNF